MYTDILSDLIITEFVSINTMYSDSGAGTKRINRPRWGIVVKFEGETEYTSGGKKYISNANNIAILPQGVSYEWQCKKQGHLYIVEFESDLKCDSIMTFPCTNSDKLLKALKELEYKRITKNNKLECIRDTYDIILMLMKMSQKSYVPASKKEKIKPVLDYIAKNYYTSLKNDELAALTSFSTVYFRKLFTEVTGMSPVTYIHYLRINKAKEMLKSDYSSISDIALSLGYANIYDFSRTFKKYTGVSPMKYLKK